MLHYQKLAKGFVVALPIMGVWAYFRVYVVQPMLENDDAHRRRGYENPSREPVIESLKIDHKNDKLEIEEAALSKLANVMTPQEVKHADTSNSLDQGQKRRSMTHSKPFEAGSKLEVCQSTATPEISPSPQRKWFYFF